MNAILLNGINTLKTESESLAIAADRLDENFIKAVNIIMACKGRVVVTGMGKSGHIAKKIAATLSSTGTPSFFMHPAEGVHGDLGMLVRGDVVIALSYSGETDEIKKIIPLIKRLSIPLISITGSLSSFLAESSDSILNGGVDREACPMNLAPTNSTTVALAIGDALAVALVEERGFMADDFALVHPAGSLGRRLLLRVDELWHSGEDLPLVGLETEMKDLLYIMSSKGLGCAIVTDGSGKLAGIITDGDLRRGMEKYLDFNKLTVKKLMSSHPKRIKSCALAAEAMAIMENNSISSIISVDEDGKPVGIVHFHDLIKAGIR